MTDCRTCLPECLPENEDAERIYFIVQDQYILGMGGAVAVNQMAIHAAMELYDVTYRRDCFEKVLKLSRHFINKQAEARKEKGRL